MKKLVLLTFAALALPTFAYWTPLQVNFVGVAGLPWGAESVYGVRINAIYGSCDTVAPFDVGIFNRTKSGAYGIRAGGFNWSEDSAGGISVGLANVDGYNAGIEVGGLNYAKEGGGVMIGGFNYSADYAGLQIGIINIADYYTGVQIGLLNFQFESAVPFFPLFNMGSGAGSVKK